MAQHPLPGLRPTPLASYLAGLGLIRVIGEQADPAIHAAWTPDGLVVETTLEDLAAWLVERYEPTPVLTPWNSGSGFGDKDKAPKETLDALLDLPEPRLAAFRQAHAIATQVGQELRSKGWTKERAVRELRNQCPEALLPWIDAAVVLAGDQPYFPPLLGTGGNDGRLEFSTTFHQRLRTVLAPDPEARTRSLAHARDLLSGDQREKLHKAMVGQFDPAGAGGKGSSPFGDAESLTNPWGYLLLIEGAMLFAATVARRHQHGARRAAMPFTVTASPDGWTGGAEGEGSSSRGEVWVPVWDQPFTWAEVKQLFAEARASWRGRPAQRAVEFYAATRTLGVARGVAAFQRYGLHQRNGLAFVAVPVERVAVQARPAVRLAARLEEWVSWVRRGDPPSAIGRALRRFDVAHLEFARDDNARALGRLLASVTDLEMAVGRSGRGRESVQVRNPPWAHEFLNVIQEIDTPELRVAVGIASCAARASVDPQRHPARSMREILLPVDPDRRWRDTPLVAGLGLRRLRAVLADVLAWRGRTAADECNKHKYLGAPTFRNGVRVPDADLHAFSVPGQLDDDELDLWLRACLALRWDGVAHEWARPQTPVVPVPVLGLLHPLAAGAAPARARPDDLAPRLALHPDWATQLVAGHVQAVHVQAARRLLQAGWRAAPPLEMTNADGVAVAAALVPRCDRPRRMLSELLATRTTPVDGSDQPTPAAVTEEAP